MSSLKLIVTATAVLFVISLNAQTKADTTKVTPIPTQKTENVETTDKKETTKKDPLSHDTKKHGTQKKQKQTPYSLPW